MYEKYRILTSKGIQERYVQATYKRTRIEMDTRYLLIDVSDRKNIILIQVSDVKNSDTSNIDTSESTQSKVKESKVYIQQQQKGTEQENEPLNNNDFKKIVDIFNNNIHPITPMEAQVISDWIDIVEADVIIEAIREAVKSGVRNIKYIEKILQSWHSNGLTTKEAVIAHLRDYQDKKNKGKVVPMKIETYDDKEDLYKQYEGLW
jgi:DnaD/phage-associated family protein